MTEHYDTNIKGISTIHNSKVDYIFYNPRTVHQTSTSIIQWNESDHRPIVADYILK